MDEVEGQGHQIVGSQLTVAATVPGVDELAFATAVEAADEGCPFSALLEARRSDGRHRRRAELRRPRPTSGALPRRPKSRAEVRPEQRDDHNRDHYRRTDDLCVQLDPPS